MIIYNAYSMMSFLILSPPAPLRKPFLSTSVFSTFPPAHRHHLTRWFPALDAIAFLG